MTTLRSRLRRILDTYALPMGVACILYELGRILTPFAFVAVTGCLLIVWLWIRDARQGRDAHQGDAQ